MSHIIKIIGAVDPHVHLRGMEWSHKGTFASETAAAVAGGYWAVFDMPNTSPATLTRESLDIKLNALKQEAMCDWGVYFCASADGNWDAYPDINTDVCGLKMFNNSTTGNLLVEDPYIREQHYKHWQGNKVFAHHAENETCAEIIELVRKYRKPTHILHVCTAYEIELITAAKEEGLPLTCGVCPHHLWLTIDDLPTLGSFGLMKPNLQTKADQESLWKALQSGIIDIVESDHAPHTLQEKLSDIPPYGVPGLETTLPLLCTAIHKNRLTIERMVELVATNPCKIFGLTPPEDTFTYIDLDKSYVIDNKSLHTLCGWSPFEGMRVQGKVVETWIRGTKVYDGAQILAEQGFGKSLYG